MTDQEAINRVKELAVLRLSAKQQKILLVALQPLDTGQAAAPAQKPGSLYSQMVAVYYEFRQALGSPVLQYGARHGAGMKKVMQQLLLLAEDDEQHALRMWQYICTPEHWRKLTAWLQGRIQPWDIAEHLEEIITRLNPKNNASGQSIAERKTQAVSAYRASLERALGDGDE